MSTRGAVIGRAAAVVILGGGAYASSATDHVSLGVSGAQALQEEQRVQECMAERGQRYDVAVPLHALQDDAVVRAHANGQDVQKAVDAVTAAYKGDPNATRMASKNQQFTRDLTGRGGCREEAAASTERDTQRALAAQDGRLHLPADIPATLNSTASVQAALQAYASCLSAQGYPATDPNDFWNRYGPDTAFSEAASQSQLDDATRAPTRHASFNTTTPTTTRTASCSR